MFKIFEFPINHSFKLNLSYVQAVIFSTFFCVTTKLKTSGHFNIEYYCSSPSYLFEFERQNNAHEFYINKIHFLLVVKRELIYSYNNDGIASDKFAEKTS